MLKRPLAALALAFPLFAAAEPLPVVASFSVLGDWVREVGGERVAVHTLVGAGEDTHMFQPAPAAAQQLARARLVVMNGLGFEGWMPRLAQAAGYKGELLVAMEGVEPLRAGAERDPHAWLSVGNAIHAVRRIAGSLCTADAAGCDEYRARAAAYTTRLQALDTEIRAAWSEVPQEQRQAVIPHDNFGYYARDYGVRIWAAQGADGESEPSARAMAALVRRVREGGIRALLVEPLEGSRLMAQIARETGLPISGKLYAEALSPAGGPATSYEAMMRHNTRTLVEAVQGVAKPVDVPHHDEHDTHHHHH
ncbi:MAG: zinc ABC transporter substrate-binding protein [Ottowia sp.]|nr:zinc ABC transporter substrate-binding protein [Ottowia sp.]